MPSAAPHLLLAYSSGLFAALSPCVLILIPLCLVRFIRHSESGVKTVQPHDASSTSSAASLTSQLFQFLLGFQLSYILFGFALAQVLTSSVQTGFKLSLGSLFLISSILAYKGRLDPLQLPLVNSPFLTGITFALLLSLNPCTIPFLAALISFSNPAHTLLSLIFFGQGLITPSLIVVLIGDKILARLEKSAWSLERIKPKMYLLLGASGVWLVMNNGVRSMVAGDVIVSMIGVVLAIILIQHAGRSETKEKCVACTRMPTGMIDAETGLKEEAMICPPQSIQQREATKVRCRAGTMIAWSSLLLCLIIVSTALMFDHNAATHEAMEEMYYIATSPTTTHARIVTTSALPTEASLQGMQFRMSPFSPPALPSTTTPTQPTAHSSPIISKFTDASTISARLQRLETLYGTNTQKQQTTTKIEGGVKPPSSAAGAAAGVEILTLEDVPHVRSDDAQDDEPMCLDLTLIPSCFQCDLIIWVYRGCILLLACVAAWYERLSRMLCVVRGRTKGSGLEKVVEEEEYDSSVKDDPDNSPAAPIMSKSRYPPVKPLLQSMQLRGMSPRQTFGAMKLHDGAGKEMAASAAVATMI